MQTGGGNGDSTELVGVDRLKTLAVFGFHFALEVLGDGGLTQFGDDLHEFLVRAVEQETEGSATRRGVVDDFSHQLVVLTEVKLVADADFTCGVHEYIPQDAFAVQLAEQEHLDDGTGLLLVAVQFGWENLGVVGHKYIAFIEFIQDVLEHLVLNFSGVLVDDHQAAVVSVFEGPLSNEVG